MKYKVTFDQRASDNHLKGIRAFINVQLRKRAALHRKKSRPTQTLKDAS